MASNLEDLSRQGGKNSFRMETDEAANGKYQTCSPKQQNGSCFRHAIHADLLPLRQMLEFL